MPDRHSNWTADFADGIVSSIAVSAVVLTSSLYVVKGGIKAIVMADVFMSFIKYASIILLAVKGTMDAGGISIVYTKSLDSGRLQLLEWVHVTMFLISAPEARLLNFHTLFERTQFFRKKYFSQAWINSSPIDLSWLCRTTFKLALTLKEKMGLLLITQITSYTLKLRRIGQRLKPSYGTMSLVMSSLEYCRQYT